MELQEFKKGTQLKVLKVTGSSGEEMPLHYCTSDAFVAPVKGTAVLLMDEEKYTISAENPVFIPAEKRHTLKLTDDFEAMVTMASGAEILFDKGD